MHWIKVKLFDSDLLNTHKKYFKQLLSYLLIIALIITSFSTNESVIYYSDNIILKSSSVSLEEVSKKELTYKEKKNIILKKYNLSENMYQVLASIVASESKANSYNDAYAVINTIYNRTMSKRWVNHINNTYGSGKGENLYYQAIAPNQFTVYSSGSYKKYMYNIPKTVEEAIIDLLYTGESLHNYLSFRSNSYKGANTVQYDKGGNKYFNEIAVNDLIQKNNVI